MNDHVKICDVTGAVTYRGNSVQNWHAKAIAYSTVLSEMWIMLKKFDIYPNGENTIEEIVYAELIRLRDKIKEQERLIHEVLIPKREVDMVGVFKETEEDRRRDCATGAHDFQPRYDKVLGRIEVGGIRGKGDPNELFDAMKDTIYVRDICRFCGKTIEREPEV